MRPLSRARPPPAPGGWRAARLARAKRTNVLVGLLLVAGAVGAMYYAFARPDPFADPFVVKAVLTSAEGVRPGLTPVRVAGVEVGRVSDVESFRGSRTLARHDGARATTRRPSTPTRR